MTVRTKLALGAAAAALSIGSADAEVTRFEVLSTEKPALQGRSFGGPGQAEKITGRATIRG